MNTAHFICLILNALLMLLAFVSQHPFTNAAPDPEFCNISYFNQFTYDLCEDEFKTFDERDRRISAEFCRYNRTIKESCCARPADISAAVRPSVRNCDITHRLARPIILGEVVKPREFPFMCAIGWPCKDPTQQTYDYKCGGVLINGKFVLTAAHCFYHSDTSPVVVRPGGAELYNRTVEDIKIIEIIEHPDYQYPSAYNDIAILKLEKEHFIDYFFESRACLWPGPPVSDENVVAMGYGDTEFNGIASDVLLKTNLTLIDNEQCSSFHEPEIGWLNNGITHKQLCASDPEGLRDTCQGDSGGPIIMFLECDYYFRLPYVVGITSFGVGCAHGVPGVYTRISEHIGWIEQVIWPYESMMYANGSQMF